MSRYILCYGLILSFFVSHVQPKEDTETPLVEVVAVDEVSDGEQEVILTSQSRETTVSIADEFAMMCLLGGDAYAVWCDNYTQWVDGIVFNHHIPPAKIFVKTEGGGASYHVTSNSYWSTDAGVFEALFSESIGVFSADLASQIAILMGDEDPPEGGQGLDAWLVVCLLEVFVRKAPHECFLEKETKKMDASLWCACDEARRCVKRLRKVLKKHPGKGAEAVPVAHVVSPRRDDDDKDVVFAAESIAADPVVTEYRFLCYVCDVLSAFVTLCDEKRESFYRKPRRTQAISDEELGDAAEEVVSDPVVE